MDGQMSIFDFPEYLPEEKKSFEKCMNPPVEENVCMFSNHTCNKEELWKVADDFEHECLKICCRQCHIRLCGARCNGSEEPTEILLVEVRGMLDDGYCPKCNIWVDDLIEECPECHNKLDWTDWKRINER